MLSVATFAEKKKPLAGWKDLRSWRMDSLAYSKLKSFVSSVEGCASVNKATEEVKKFYIDLF